jgi:hypothetical protein
VAKLEKLSPTELLGDFYDHVSDSELTDAQMHWAKQALTTAQKED